MHDYTAYGLHIRSELPLPELVSTDRIHTGNDVVIHETEIAYPGATERATTDLVQSSPQSVYLFYDGIGVLSIQNGREIAVDPSSDENRELLRRLVLGPALGVLLHQRGRLVLHASTVVVDDVSVILLGDSGAGKSTLAAALASRGGSVIADDITALSFAGPVPKAIGGVPALKLRPTVAETVGGDVRATTDSGDEFEKTYYRTGQSSIDVRHPHPVGRSYILTEGDAMDIDRLHPRRAMIELVRRTYTAQLVDDGDTSSTHFHQCARLASAVPFERIQRTSDLDQLSELAKRVEEDSADER